VAVDGVLGLSVDLPGDHAGGKPDHEGSVEKQLGIGIRPFREQALHRAPMHARFAASPLFTWRTWLDPTFSWRFFGHVLRGRARVDRARHT
jgi:hypothetical protein